MLGGMGTRAGRILKPAPATHGYLQVSLCREGKILSQRVHVLVARAFIPNPASLPEVNHKGPKSDCRASQLEWITKGEHGRDRAKRQQIGQGVHFHKQTKKWHAQYSPDSGKNPKHIGVFDTYEEALAAREAKIATL
jgi:hypothetical protein